MTPRAALPGADELFRATAPAPGTSSTVPAGPQTPGRAGSMAGHDPDERTAQSGPGAEGADGPSTPARSTASSRRRSASRSTTGRERHEEKITVYVSAGELVELERARLTLRAEHGIAVDRGRIVREALSVLLADLDTKAADSILVRRLAGR